MISFYKFINMFFFSISFINDIDINRKQIFTYIDYSFSIKIINIIIHNAFGDILSKGAK